MCDATPAPSPSAVLASLLQAGGACLVFSAGSEPGTLCVTVDLHGEYVATGVQTWADGIRAANEAIERLVRAMMADILEEWMGAETLAVETATGLGIPEGDKAALNQLRQWAMAIKMRKWLAHALAPALVEVEDEFD